MKIKIRIIFTIIIVLIVSSGCTKTKATLSFPNSSTVVEAQTTMIEASSDDIKEIKYIFIIIGDGMGETHLKIGDLFKKIITGDMNESGSWNSLDNHILVEAGSESARGGTMIATGEKTPTGNIAQRDDGTNLTTILDVAKENGLSTGVITNSSLIDATPATFLSHADSRFSEYDIAYGIPFSNVDFIAGGGLEYMFNTLPEEYIKDSGGSVVNLNEDSQDIAYQMQENGYMNYLGLNGSISFVENKNIESKVFASFTEGNMPYYYQQRQSKYCERMMSIPSLSQMAQKGIESLSQNENGFCVMVEASAIDDASHKGYREYIALEMGIIEFLQPTSRRNYHCSDSRSRNR